MTDALAARDLEWALNTPELEEEHKKINAGVSRLLPRKCSSFLGCAPPFSSSYIHTFVVFLVSHIV